MKTDPLSRREREIMDIVYRLGRATVAQVRAEMSSPPGYSSVRTLMGVLEGKGELTHAQEGRAYVYRPARPLVEARTSAVQRVVRAFFGGSVGEMAVALVEQSSLSAEELAELKAAIARAESEGR